MRLGTVSSKTRVLQRVARIERGRSQERIQRKSEGDQICVKPPSPLPSAIIRSDRPAACRIDRRTQPLRRSKPRPADRDDCIWHFTRIVYRSVTLLSSKSEEACLASKQPSCGDYRGHPTLEPALLYWLQKRAERTMPRKGDIDPAEIAPRLLPHLQIIDVIDGGQRFHYRLIGTALVDAYGKDYTGLYVDEMVSGDRLDFILRAYRMVCELKAPVFCHNRYLTVRNTDLFATRVYMPLSEDGTTVQFILGALSFAFGDSVHTGVWGSGTIEPATQYIGAIGDFPPAAETARPA